MNQYPQKSKRPRGSGLPQMDQKYPATQAGKILRIPGKFISEYKCKLWGGETRQCSKYSGRVPVYSINRVLEYVESDEGKVALNDFYNREKSRESLKKMGVDPDEPKSSKEAVDAVMGKFGNATKLSNYTMVVMAKAILDQEKIWYCDFVRLIKKNGKFQAKKSGYVIAKSDYPRYVEAERMMRSGKRETKG